jgi:hypothetical protein
MQRRDRGRHSLDRHASYAVTAWLDETPAVTGKDRLGGRTRFRNGSLWADVDKADEQ